MTISKYSKSDKDYLGKGAYYLAVSALQKCVRRGDVLRAVNFGKLCWRIEPYRLFSRLWTILFEDCGRDLPTLLAFYRYRAGFSQFEPLAQLIAMMCRAGKTRDVLAMAELIQGTNLTQSMLTLALQGHPIHSRVLDLNREWYDREWFAYSVWDYGVGDANYDWTLELAERGMKWDWSKFSIGLPYFFMRDTLEYPPTQPVVECGGVHLYRGWFPLEAVDDHTRQGKASFRVYLKYREVHFGETLEDFGDWVFFQEGWKYTNLRPYSYDFFSLLNSMRTSKSGIVMSNFTEPEVTAHWQRDVLPELNRVRTWFLNKTCCDEMDRIKVAYYDQWISFVE